MEVHVCVCIQWLRTNVHAVWVHHTACVHRLYARFLARVFTCSVCTRMLYGNTRTWTGFRIQGFTRTWIIHMRRLCCVQETTLNWRVYISGLNKKKLPRNIPHACIVRMQNTYNTWLVVEYIVELPGGLMNAYIVDRYDEYITDWIRWIWLIFCGLVTKV